MANRKHPFFNFLFFILLCGAILVQGSRVLHNSPAETEVNFKESSKRLLIGSVAPTCTYNECKGCKYKCRAEQVPVEGNDPINSPYHYKCVCHR
ncbi:hypothetical protein CDL12_21658 [Handroanthus impetiginosus]|uniref:Stomagen C-terminal domain-containing protein n=1 Tax=Handroanthus impetiginosus TaxID=429701 RepID=A0A2G9G745_9LAMI|nr:hypothetical protein CDL12_26367 [Handroanthus impetiginosus]PIN05797.1 hypothetical protein CDL12_21658 [Handroanthus impetiginosus]